MERVSGREIQQAGQPVSPVKEVPPWIRIDERTILFYPKDGQGTADYHIPHSYDRGQSESEDYKSDTDGRKRPPQKIS